MCIEDFRLGRKTGVSVSTITLPAAGTVTPIVAASEVRTHIAIYQSNRVSCSVSPIGVTPSATEGIALGYVGTPVTDAYLVQSPPLEIDIQQHGRAAQLPWNGSSTGGANATLLVIETFLEEQ